MLAWTIVCCFVFVVLETKGDFCVLEKLVTKPGLHLCKVQTTCTNNGTWRSKRSVDARKLPLVKVGSPSAGHFESVDEDNGVVDKGIDYGTKVNYNSVPTASNAPVQVCPSNLTYRTYDGGCNNHDHPNWGTTNSPFLRLLYPRYANNLGQPALSVTGAKLPEVRVISTTIFQDIYKPWKNYTLAVMQWGQLVAHDTGLSPSAIDLPIDCCNPEIMYTENCLSIEIPTNDSFYSQYNQTCISMIRSKSIIESYNCSNILQNTNGVTHYIDLSHIYGSSFEIASELRQFQNGLLTVSISNNREFPKLSDDPEFECNSADANITCFQSGDQRVNQNTELTCLQTVLIREHNRISRELLVINPHWNDEKLFQETRRIMIGMFQHITYKEWMPLILGKQYMLENNILPEDGFSSDYQSEVNVGTLNVFITSTYRTLHSQIQGKLLMLNESRCPFRSINISDYMNKPGIVVEDNNYDSFLLGLTSENSRKLSRFVTTQMTDLMFHGDYPYGEDLISFDIQRGRDHGLPNYNSYRKLCGFSKATNFSDLSDFITQENIALLESVYSNVEDIDSYVGCALETWVDGTSVGPTTLCLLGEQFVRKKVGDSYWYELKNQSYPFTLDQLTEIKKSTLSRLLCDNSDNITTIQPNSFLEVTVEGNQLVNCTEIPALNLTKWQE